MEAFYELQASDVGRYQIKAFGRSWLTSGFIGRVLPGDVGKRVYLRGDILQVENDAQRDKRVAREATTPPARETWRVRELEFRVLVMEGDNIVADCGPEGGCGPDDASYQRAASIARDHNAVVAMREALRPVANLDDVGRCRSCGCEPEPAEHYCGCAPSLEQAAVVRARAALAQAGEA